MIEYQVKTFPATNRDFYSIYSNQNEFLKYCLDKNLLNSSSTCINPNCPKPQNNSLKIFKQYYVYNCKNRGCTRRWAARNNIFALNSDHKSKTKISHEKVLEIIWYWAWGNSIKNTALQTKLNNRTIIAWFRKIRDYLYLKFLEAPPAGGEQFEWQIDESYFSGRRKYNRGRYKTGDKKSKESIKDKLLAIITNNKSKRNYGNQVEGPWVFGMVLQNKATITLNKTIRSNNNSKIKIYARSRHPFNKLYRHQIYKDRRKVNNKETRLNTEINRRKWESTVLEKLIKSKHELRMFVVKRRDAETLIPIIKRNALRGSDIHSDEWRAYSKLKTLGYRHFTVNHKENFVNPKTGKHTQLVECLWGVNKRKIPNRIRGKSCHLLQAYLAQQWFKSLHGDFGPELFQLILPILKEKSYEEVKTQIKRLKYF